MLTAKQKFTRRKTRVRSHLAKSATGRPRLSVFRSNKNIYVQVIDDSNRQTLVSASTLDKEVSDKLKTGSDVKAAEAVGQLLAVRAKAAGIDQAVFDRGGYLYHGRVKALAEAARAGGLSF